MSYVYLIEAVGTPYVKVGVAIDPRLRALDLQVGCPFELRVREQRRFGAGAPEVEDLIHTNLNLRHVRGEWFHWPDGWTLNDALTAPERRSGLVEWLAWARPRLAAASDRLAPLKDKALQRHGQWHATVAVHHAMKEANRVGLPITAEWVQKIARETAASARRAVDKTAAL